MRLLLILYIITFLALNFLIDHPVIFLLALTTFPVLVYLLVTKKSRKQKVDEKGHVTVTVLQSETEPERY